MPGFDCFCHASATIHLNFLPTLTSGRSRITFPLSTTAANASPSSSEEEPLSLDQGQRAALGVVPSRGPAYVALGASVMFWIAAFALSATADGRGM